MFTFFLWQHGRRECRVGARVSVVCQLQQLKLGKQRDTNNVFRVVAPREVPRLWSPRHGSEHLALGHGFGLQRHPHSIIYSTRANVAAIARKKQKQKRLTENFGAGVPV